MVQILLFSFLWGTFILLGSLLGQGLGLGLGIGLDNIDRDLSVDAAIFLVYKLLGMIDSPVLVS